MHPQVCHTPDYASFLESEDYKLLVKVPLAEILRVSYCEATPLAQGGPMFEIWTSMQSNYIFQASTNISSASEGGRHVATKQVWSYKPHSALFIS